MAHAKLIRPVLIHTTLPEDIHAKLCLHLYSEVEQRIPKGAFQRFFVERITEYFKALEAKDVNP